MRAGELFAGYGGLALSVSEVFGATTEWVAEFDPDASKVLDQRFPGVPNLGDVTTAAATTPPSKQRIRPPELYAPSYLLTMIIPSG